MAGYFNVEKARADGFSDQEIQDYMKERGLKPSSKKEGSLKSSDIVSKYTPNIDLPERVGGALGLGVEKASEATGVSPMALAGQSPIADQGKMLEAAKHPIETAKKLGGVAKRTAQAVMPGFKPNPDEEAAVKIGKMGASLMSMVIPGEAPVGATMMAKSLGPTGAVKAWGITKYLARQALGYTKALLRNPLARREADKAAQLALEKDVIPALGNPDTMFKNIGILRARAGKALDRLYKSVGDIKLDQIFDGLEVLKNDLTKGMKGPVWEETIKRINHAQESIAGILSKGENITLKDVVATKKKLGQTVNWLKDGVAADQEMKAILMNIQKSIGKTFESMGGDIEKWKVYNKVYGSANNAMNAMNNRLAMSGNAVVSLPSVIAGAGSNPIQSLARTGATEFIKRRGAAIGARAAYGVQRSRPQFAIPNAARSAYLGLREE